MKRRLLTLFMSALLVLGLMPTAALPVNATAGNGDIILAFSSDIHNEPAGESAERLGNWIAKVNREVGGSGIDFMTFCGDMGRSQNETVNNDKDVFSPEGYMAWCQAAMTAADEALPGKTAYTTGNHDINDGGYVVNRTPPYASGTTQSKFVIDTMVKQTSRYEIYCLGSASGSQEYTTSPVNQIKALADYLGTCTDRNKIYIIATHYPLHYYKKGYNSRTTGNAYSVIETINKAIDSKGITVVFVWGHNHYLSDSNYNQIYKPGDSLQYTSNSNDKSNIKFWYVPAGCMADSEDIGGNAGTVRQKAMMLRLPADEGKPCSFSFYDKDQNLIGSSTPMVIGVTGVKLNSKEVTLEIGKSVKLSASVSPSNAGNKGIMWSSADPSTATVGSDGTVRAVKAGKVDIIARSKENSSIYDRCTLTVTEEGEVDKAKASARAELEGYKNPGNYRDAQKAELAAAISRWGETIDNAESTAEVAKLLAEAKAELDRIMTDAQLTEEEINGIYDPKMPKVKIKKPSSGKKMLTAKWQKLGKKSQNKVKGIEIWVAPDLNFKEGRVIRKAGKSKYSAKVSGLRKKTTYYVMVRTYRNTNGIKYVGAWSKTRKLKTR